MARAVNIGQLLTMRFPRIPLEGRWRELLGQPELRGSILIWGDSAQGKTSFALQLAKELSKYESVLYDSLEEGISESIRAACVREGMVEVGSRVLLLDNEPIAELTERLARPKSRNVVIVDSLQYTGMTFEAYKELLERFPKKLFVFVSHADGREPAGRIATQVKFNANIKIRVSGFTAYAISRYGGGMPYTISDEMAARINPE
ncbi:hypothetical protein [uncultured Rikenella sp.]|uniref:hypothetical protein n=2 Tax=uncultured Rikenella sp. TaxID=368003 RepID=UPI00260F9F39|nr:hypothetical protein [uncultured Rikenella sp.]